MSTLSSSALHRSQTQAFNELRAAARSNAMVSSDAGAVVGAGSSSSSVVAAQAQRIHRLEEELQELQASLVELAGQLAAARYTEDVCSLFPSTGLLNLQA